MNLLWLSLLIAIGSGLLTWYLRRYALAKDLMDVPNERSSHLTPTPRGGGLAIVITFLLGLVSLWGMSLLPTIPFAALTGAGLLVALIGFIDDHGHIAARWRLLAHFIAAGWIVFWLGGLPPLPLLGSLHDLGWFGNLLAVIALVWLLNLYNFMDGIDGIAGVEAVTSSLVVGLLLMVVMQEQAIASVVMILVAAVLGFLIWNFPPAKIFMGDVGSGFLGLMLGALALYNSHLAPQMLWVWVILLGIFIVDATVTLIRRLLSGDKVYEAHRSHAYQHAVQRWGSHRLVTLAVTFINLLWLAPLAWGVIVKPEMGILFMVISYLPLIGLAFYFQAGNKNYKTEPAD